MVRPPIRSGNPAIDAAFDLCVYILLRLAALFGVSYNTINIWVFCIVWPLFTLILIAAVVVQHLKIRKLRLEMEAGHAATQGPVAPVAVGFAARADRADPPATRNR